MPMLTHEQIHGLLVGIAAMQKVNGDVFAQTEYTEHTRFNHGHYVAALHDIAGSGEPRQRAATPCLHDRWRGPPGIRPSVSRRTTHGSSPRCDACFPVDLRGRKAARKKPPDQARDRERAERRFWSATMVRAHPSRTHEP